jgi:hypothetical protein
MTVLLKFAVVELKIRGDCYCGTEHIYTGCPRRNVPDFGRVFLMLSTPI